MVRKLKEHWTDEQCETAEREIVRNAVRTAAARAELRLKRIAELRREVATLKEELVDRDERAQPERTEDPCGYRCGGQWTMFKDFTWRYDHGPDCPILRSMKHD